MVYLNRTQKFELNALQEEVKMLKSKDSISKENNEKFVNEAQHLRATVFDLKNELSSNNVEIQKATTYKSQVNLVDSIYCLM